MISPPPGRTAAPGREAGAGPAPTSQPPTPAGTMRGRRTCDSKRARTRTVWGPSPPWPERCPEPPLCCLPREGRGLDRGKATPSPAGPPAAKTGGMAHRPPPPPPQPPALKRPRRAGPIHGEHTARSKVGGKRDRATPRKKKLNGAPDRGKERRGARTEWNGPTSAQHPDCAKCTRHTSQWRGGGTRTPRKRERTHTQRTRGEYQKGNRTEPAERPDRMEWRTCEQVQGTPARNGLPHTARTGGAGRGRRGGHDTRHRPDHPDPAASAAHTPPGHCTRHGSSGAPRHAPAPSLGSRRASPRGSHWRQASSTGPAAQANRATTHQGGDAVGKSLQVRLLSDALTGEWRNGEAGEGRGSEP